MKKTFSIIWAMAAAAAFGFTDDGKNLAPANWLTLPADANAAMKAFPAKDWNFNFRAYGATSDLLWTDPATQRGALAGASGDKRTAAIGFACDDDAFTILVLCTEPGLKTWLADGKKYPSPAIEMIIMPGDADTEKITEHYQVVYEGAGKFSEYAFTVPDRTHRRRAPYTKACEGEVGDGAILVRITCDWAGWFDTLPLWPEKRDNFWRVGCIPYATGGTWGGVVQQQNQAGYLRWPAFTRDQKLAIMKKTLLKGWAYYKGVTESFSLGYGKLQTDKGETVGNLGYAAPDPGLYHTEKVAKEPRTYPNYSEDPAFRPTLRAIYAERNALGAQIAKMDELDDAAMRAFYEKASQMLFNVTYDIQEAYLKYQKGILLEGK